METFEQNQALMNLYHKVSEAEAQEINGAEALSGDEVFKRLRDKHGY